ncbi:MAG: helix-turn-helix transcriptional regulator [Saprospiraceae bacterium]
MFLARKGNMMSELPEISFEKHSDLNIEVFDFEQLFNLLSQADDHDPFAPHKIQFYLILFVTETSYTHAVDFKSHEVKEGNMLFVTKNQVHQFSKDLIKSKGFGIAFSHLFVNEHYFLTDNFRLNRLFNYHMDSPVLRQAEIGGVGMGSLVADLHVEFYADSVFAKAEILASTLRLILLKAERAKELHSVVQVNVRWLEVFGDFTKMLESDYANSRNSRDYAARLFVSYKLLNDIVKNMTGKTVKAFIDDFVVVEIKRHLISSSMSVNEISVKVGFKESSNMVNFFKKNTDTTPLQFRRML